MPRTSMVVLYGVSFALHASLGFGVTEIEPTPEPKRIAITVVNAPKPKPKVEDPPPPPPPPPPVEAAPKKAAPKAKVAEAPKPAADPAPTSAPTFGIAMTGGVGAGGIAVPVGDSLSAAKEPPKRVAEAKTLTEPKRAVAGACEEPPSKPKPLQMPRPEYTDEARSAAIEGKVRVELTVDESGAVKSAKVLDSLGHGLDEAAIAAVRAATFEPASQCGKHVSATFVVAIRFSL